MREAEVPVVCLLVFVHLGLIGLLLSGLAQRNKLGFLSHSLLAFLRLPFFDFDPCGQRHCTWCVGVGAYTWLGVGLSASTGLRLLPDGVIV
jgi:hypothetical protein